MLAPEGRLFIWTFEPDHFTGHHLRSYLPDLPAIDLARFPTADVLTGELDRGGLRDVEVRWFEQAGSVTRSAPRSSCARGTSRRSTSCRRSRWPQPPSDWSARPQPPSRRLRPCCAGS